MPPSAHRLLPHPQVADMGGGALLLLAASADGSVSRLRMQVPTQPGAQPEEIQVCGRGGAVQEGHLWLTCLARMLGRR